MGNKMLPSAATQDTRLARAPGRSLQPPPLPLLPLLCTVAIYVGLAVYKLLGVTTADPTLG